jgi:AraC family transcriptional regulator
LHAEALGGLLSIELLRLLQDGAPASRPSPRGGLAAWQQKRVMDFIEEHLAEDVSLEVLADLVRLSPYHFLRSFKQSHTAASQPIDVKLQPAFQARQPQQWQAFGEPPYRYWTGRRIERAAKALLAKPRTSVTEIALDVGFHGTSAFSATFHRITGQTPTDYRRDLE